MALNFTKTSAHHVHILCYACHFRSDHLYIAMNAHKYWLFDLDETLHHAGHQVFPLISLRMTDYIMHHLAVDEEEAHRLRKLYWWRYGATLRGLVKHHRVDATHFLRTTHDMAELLPLIGNSQHLARLLSALPGRKWVFSNGPQHYVEAVVAHLGIGHAFDELFGIECLGRPKPHAAAYHRVLRKAGIRAGQCVMVEDTLANLQTARQLGMKTVWISSQQRKPAWVDWRINSLAQLPRLPLNGATAAR